MILKTSKKVRRVVKRFKELHVEMGRLTAAREFNERLTKLSTEFDNALKARDKAHESAINQLTTQEKIYSDKCKELEKEKETLSELIKSMRLDSEKVHQYSSNLEASWQDEKLKKWMALNHDKNETQILLATNEKKYQSYMNKQRIV